MTTAATAESLERLIAGGVVLHDVWGRHWEPRPASTPAVEELAEPSSRTWRPAAPVASDNRAVCRRHHIVGLPTNLEFVDGIAACRLGGAHTTVTDVVTARQSVIDGRR